MKKITDMINERYMFLAELRTLIFYKKKVHTRKFGVLCIFSAKNELNTDKYIILKDTDTN